MGCGCNSNYPFPQQCCGSYSTPATPAQCRPHLPVLRKNFTVPAKGNPVTIELTDTQSLYRGMSVMIGSGFYLITDIIDALHVTVVHNGYASQDSVMVAYHDGYGCAQYPIIPIGKVTIDRLVSVVGLEDDGSTSIASSIISTNFNNMTYGYLGPTTVQFQAEIDVAVQSTPAWLGIDLPVPTRSTVPLPVFTAVYDDDATGWRPAVSVLGAGGYIDYAIIGKGPGELFIDGSAVKARVSGIYEVL